LSFFDDVDETRVEPPSSDRPRRQLRGGRRPPGGGSRGPARGPRPPSNDQVRVRRGVAAVAVLIAIVLIVLGVHSCAVSQANSALKNYSDDVYSLIQASNSNGQRFFGLLANPGGANNAPALQNQVEATRITAQNQLSRAEGLSVPGQLKQAHDYLVKALQLRRDAIASIAGRLQPALASRNNTAAVNAIAADMARFYASDVLYKDYTLPMIVAALNNAHIAVGGASGEPIASGQILPSLSWLSASYVASQLRVSYQGSPSSGTCTAGSLHGHSLNSVSVGGTTLQTGSTNTISGSPTPVFSFNITNGGTSNESNVTLKVSFSGSSVKGQTVIPQTTAGQTTNNNVTLNSSPPAGNYTVTATVVAVPCEKNTTNNTLTFPVTVQ
jgi:hypothetical protein